MELLHTDSERITRLISYLKILCEGTTDKQTYQNYADVLETATAFETNQAIDALLQDTNDVESYATPIARFIRSVSSSLERAKLPSYPSKSLLESLDLENEKIKQYSRALQSLSKELKDKKESALKLLIQAVQDCTMVRDHYIRLQNELFPLFEQSSNEHNCVKLMWALQDVVLDYQKRVVTFTGSDLTAFWKVFGTYYFHIELLRYRETYILFPVAYRAIVEQKDHRSQMIHAAFSSATGSLRQEQLERIFMLLPLDIAFIGVDDRVAFYSDPPHRIFPRSPQVIGRLVHNCHPPKSVATVEAILSSFKEGSKDTEEFYLSLNGKFVHIQYYAVRSTDGVYLGTLEVTQDATHLRSLEGEKRLLE